MASGALNKLVVMGQRSTLETTTVEVFVMDGNVPDAIEAATARCEKRGLKYLYCKRADAVEGVN